MSLIGGFNLSLDPQHPGQTPGFTLAGVNPRTFRGSQRKGQLEQSYYGVLALQGVLGADIDYQIAGFSRYSTLSFHPDQNGDLIYNGEASRVFRGDFANGLQGDFAYRAIPQHTIRTGFYFTGEGVEIDNHALVFPRPGAQDNALALTFRRAISPCRSSTTLRTRSGSTAFTCKMNGGQLKS